MTHLIDLFIDPKTEAQLEFTPDSKMLHVSGTDSGFMVHDGVIDFSKAIPIYGTDRSYSATRDESNGNQDFKNFYDNSFENAAKADTGFYEFNRLPPITQSGHYRRMTLLERIELGPLDEKVAVDFGTGPWGFACIFPKLQQASACIGFDVSSVALSQARCVTPEGLIKRVMYATSDGNEIPLKDSSVDIFFGGEVIEHVSKPEVFLQNIARVCKDDAIVILTTPNRDALNYLAENQPYCVGPEHIALMNYWEFVAKLDLFFDIKEVVGYDTSISPIADTTITDEKILELIQQRAEKFPELASGMIAILRVDKSKYEQNKKALIRKEFIWSNHIFCVNGASQGVDLFGKVTGLSLSPGSSLAFAVFTAETTLLFWGNPWSGFVQIRHNGKMVAEIDLYLSNSGFVRIDLPLEYPFGNLVLLATGDKRATSNGAGVIFYKALGYVPRIEEKNTCGLRSPLINKYFNKYRL